MEFDNEVCGFDYCASYFKGVWWGYYVVMSVMFFLWLDGELMLCYQ